MYQAQQARVLDMFQREQSEVHRQISLWRQWCYELCELGDPRFGEMGTRLEQIRSELSQHFAHEDQIGCFREIAQQHPELEKIVVRLELQHKQLLEELDGMIRGLEACEPAFSSWGEARQAFEAFLGRLEDHEREESAVLEQWKTTGAGTKR